jgi:hypothetical protein
MAAHNTSKSSTPLFPSRPGYQAIAALEEISEARAAWYEETRQVRDRAHDAARELRARSKAIETPDGAAEREGPDHESEVVQVDQRWPPEVEVDEPSPEVAANSEHEPDRAKPEPEPEPEREEPVKAEPTPQSQIEIELAKAREAMAEIESRREHEHERSDYEHVRAEREAAERAADDDIIRHPGED